MKTSDLDYIEERIGSGVAYAIGFHIFYVSNVALIIPEYVKPESLPTEVYKGDTKTKLNQIVGKLSDIPYVVDQSDPRLVWDEGGNCQSISLVLMAYLKSNGIESTPILTSGISHMLVEADIDGQAVKIDLVKGVID